MGIQLNLHVQTYFCNSLQILHLSNSIFLGGDICEIRNKVYGALTASNGTELPCCGYSPRHDTGRTAEEVSRIQRFPKGVSVKFHSYQHSSQHFMSTAHTFYILFFCFFVQGNFLSAPYFKTQINPLYHRNFNSCWLNDEIKTDRDIWSMMWCCFLILIMSLSRYHFSVELLFQEFFQPICELMSSEKLIWLCELNVTGKKKLKLPSKAEKFWWRYSQSLLSWIAVRPNLSLTQVEIWVSIHLNSQIFTERKLTKHDE